MITQQMKIHYIGIADNNLRIVRDQLWFYVRDDLYTVIAANIGDDCTHFFVFESPHDIFGSGFWILSKILGASH